MKRFGVGGVLFGRLAAASGVIFVAVLMVAPDPDIGIENPSAEQVREFYLSHEQSFRAALLLGGLAYSLFLLFLTVLRARLRRAENGDLSVTALAMAAGVLVAAFQVVGTTLWAVPALVLTSDSSPTRAEAAAMVAASSNGIVEMATFWRGLLLGAVAVVVLRHGAMPRWLGWTAAVLSAGALIGAVGFVESPVAQVATGVGFGSYVGFHAWTLAASIVMAVRSSGTVATPADPASVPS